MTITLIQDNQFSMTAFLSMSGGFYTVGYKYNNNYFK